MPGDWDNEGPILSPCRSLCAGARRLARREYRDSCSRRSLRFRCTCSDSSSRLLLCGLDFVVREFARRAGLVDPCDERKVHVIPCRALAASPSCLPSRWR